MEHLLGAVAQVYEGLEKMRIEDCFYQGGCKKRWSELSKTKDPDLGFCHECKKHVHLLHSVEDLERTRGEPICAAFLLPLKPAIYIKDAKPKSED